MNLFSIAAFCLLAYSTSAFCFNDVSISCDRLDGRKLVFELKVNKSPGENAGARTNLIETSLKTQDMELFGKTMRGFKVGTGTIYFGSDEELVHFTNTADGQLAQREYQPNLLVRDVSNISLNLKHRFLDYSYLETYIGPHRGFFQIEIQGKNGRYATIGLNLHKNEVSELRECQWRWK